MGEYQFSSLCSAIGITVNKSERDYKAWDYIVEFPFEFSDNYDDLVKTPIKCLVQIKSTDTKKCSSWSIKLKNLLYFVKTPLPTFFCLIKFNGKDLPQSISLVHVDKTIIEETLKTIREYNVNNKDMGDSGKSIRFKKVHFLNAITGKELKKTIESYISMGMESYTQNKLSIVNNIGYEKGAGNFIFRANPYELRDLSLGIRNEMKFTDLKMFEERFGISASKPKIALSTGGMTIIPEPSGEIDLIFSQEKHGVGVKIKFQKYSSGLDEHLPIEKRKFRLKNSLIEIIIQPAIEGIFKLDWTKDSFSLAELNKAYQLFTMVKSEENIYISVDDKGVVSPLMTMQVNPILNQDELDDNFELLDLANKSYLILEKYGLHQDAVISLNEIYANRMNIDDFYTIAIENYKHEYKIIFTETNIDKNNLADKIAGIISVNTVIGNYRLTCIFAIISDKLSINEKGNYELSSQETGYHNFLVFPLSKKPSDEIMDKEFNNVIDNVVSDKITSIRVIN